MLSFCCGIISLVSEKMYVVSEKMSLIFEEISDFFVETSHFFEEISLVFCENAASFSLLWSWDSVVLFSQKMQLCRIVNCAAQPTVLSRVRAYGQEFYAFYCHICHSYFCKFLCICGLSAFIDVF